MSDCVRFIPVLCVQTTRCYGQGMTTTIMYIIQLFIHKKTRLSTKIKNQMYNLIFITVTCYGRNLPESGISVP